MERPRDRKIIRRVIGNSLREAKNLRLRMGPKTPQMRTGDVAQAAVLRIDVVQRQPDGDDVRRRQAEVEIVLMRRRDVVRARRLVEPLRLIDDSPVRTTRSTNQCRPIPSVFYVIAKKRITASITATR